jgi:hypothetical protein
MQASDDYVACYVLNNWERYHTYDKYQTMYLHQYDLPKEIIYNFDRPLWRSLLCNFVLQLSLLFP